MEDKIALIAPGGVLMAEFLEPASHRQACRSGRCLTASYQRDRARGSVHHADIALWLGVFLRHGCAVLDRSPVALRRGRSRRTHCAGCWARHFAGDCVGRTVGSMKNHNIRYLDDGRGALPLGNFPSRSQKVIDVDVETCETRSESKVDYEVRPVAFDRQFRDVDFLWWRTSMGCNAYRLGEREGKLVDKWYLMVPKLTRPVGKGNVANLSKDGSAPVERF